MALDVQAEPARGGRIGFTGLQVCRAGGRVPFYFSLEDGSVIDAKYGGNRARWINHACKPNCEAREKDGRVFIHALRDIDAGEELFYDYGLVIEGRQTKALKAQFACHCGAKKCRGTMLAPPEKKEKKP
ncbi:SET domain-containing protein [Ralstonia pseudosolanacearum]|uniref:SET domain-containing protein n=1 Tax=Ralstonia pseudosolanacearum TaxID=1310165 RepID=UPI003CFA1825